MLPIIEINGVRQEFSAYKLDLRSRRKGLGYGDEVIATITLWRGDCGDVIEEPLEQDEDGKPFGTRRVGWSGRDVASYSGKLEFPPKRDKQGRQLYQLTTNPEIEVPVP